MFDYLRKALGFVGVEETRDNIIITGLDKFSLGKDISNLWNTTKIEKHMFKKSSGSSIIIGKFFALEFVYMLKKVKADSKSRTSRALIDKILEGLYEKTWVSKTIKRHPTMLDYTKLELFYKKPLSHQREFFEVVDDNMQRYNLDGYMLAAAPGGGKTLSNLMLSECLNCDVFIAICPKVAVDKPWVKTLQEEYKVSRQCWSSDSPYPITANHNYYVCHYDALPKLLEILPKIKDKKVYIALDECHNLNNSRSQRVEIFQQICDTLNNKVIMWSSGTPIKAIGKEAIPFLYTIDPFFRTGDTEKRFAKIFGMSQGRANEVLAHRIGLSSFKVPKATIKDDPPIEMDIKLTFPNAKNYTLAVIKDKMNLFINERIAFYKANRDKYLKDYFNCIDYFKTTLRTEQEHQAFNEYQKGVRIIVNTSDYSTIPDILVRVNTYENRVIIPLLPNSMKPIFRDSKSVYKYVELKIRGEALGRILGRERINCHREMVENFDFLNIIADSLKKTIIFTSYVDVVTDIESKLRRQKLNPLVVYGETTKDIKPIISKFHSDERINPLIATFSSLSTAVPITVANTIIMFNQPFRPHEKEQAIARADRLGQDTQVFVMNILLDTGEEPNISTRNLSIMEWAKAQVDQIMGVTVDVSLESSTPDAWFEETEALLNIKQKPTTNVLSTMSDW